MSYYWIGDIQGCDQPLGRLLDLIDFSPSRDHLVLLGDLINRGPSSLAVLKRLMALQGSVQCVLGNHDLHGLAVAFGLRQTSRLDTLDELLQAQDSTDWCTWLRHQPMALLSHDVLSVHAGVLPSWTVQQTLSLAGEVESVLRGPNWHGFLGHMYGNTPASWHEELEGFDRLRVVVNALTRLRFCTPSGEMEFKTKEGAENAPKGYIPWFDVPGRRTADTTVAFGHWSSLRQPARQDLWALDTGCVWGGCLSAMRWREDGTHERLQVPCQQAQKPALKGTHNSA
ncbi:MAG: symmetrical bis(5'-nucleosyl)-tetraphosphatase [Limnohabitans sp.]|jgi:bis(5'-nucleosyl)-tetraphosphatase (symmetrical)|uniref:symmetrical bis(5'-nucleosyl)-tetraphosphatase n=1 Tax=Limnohabitans sp. TaxID=1907725 RepID=UPI0025EB1858|nr:symmetrical bis(5'-nucleosyl)-tetraphosphatase [Limnohabitans sp.]MCO4087752.1 symmetrical bis(5'-nucleosyl)-tetraphosphatase [Limnohabitans sp.]